MPEARGATLSPTSLDAPLVVELPHSAERVALCGGPYSNFGAVEAFLQATARVEHRFCLGDIGGFGPLPGRTLELVRGAGLVCLQGNYDYAVGHGERDCGCGYLDPLDRHHAQVSFDYTLARTGPAHREWLRALPRQIELRWRGRRLLLVHGSPDSVNEFVWESETGEARIRAWLEGLGVDGICATHSGLPWVRRAGHGFWFNVGVLGRPAHERARRVFYGLLEFPQGAAAPEPVLVPLDYDPAPVAAAMRDEGLPDAFVESLLTGLWTTCAGVLPPGELEPADRLAPSLIT